MDITRQISDEYLTRKSLAVGYLLEMKNEIEKRLNEVKTCDCECSSCICSQILERGVQVSLNLPQIKSGGSNSGARSTERGWTISEGQYSVLADPDELLRSGNISVENKGQNSQVNASLSNIEDPSSIKELCYKIEHAYVIVFEVFRFLGDGSQKFESKADGTRVKDFFEERTRFTVQPFYNPTADLMRDTCQQVAKNKDLEHHDGLIVVITTHGDKDGIYGSDKIRIKVEEIVEAFRNDKCKYLVGKPKLFFVEACRGGGIDYGVCSARSGCSGIVSDLCPDTVFLEEQKASLTIPSDSDVLVAYSTTFGNQSYAYVKESGGKIPLMGTGTWFITILIDTLDHFGDTEDLATMLTRVNRAISCMGESYQRKQISSHVSMLRHKIYFGLKECTEMDASLKGAMM